MLIKFPNERTKAEKQTEKTPSNTRLLEELDTLLKPCDDNLDVHQIEDRLARLQQEAPVMEAYDPAKAWTDLQNRHPMLLEAESGGPEKTSGAKSRRGRSALRVAAITAASMFALAVTVSAFGGDTVQRVLDWGRGLLTPDTAVTDGFGMPYRTGEDHRVVAQMMEADGYTDHACPSWFPADYPLQKTTRSLPPEPVSYLAVYGAEETVTFRVQLLPSDQFSLKLYQDEGGYEYALDGLVFYIYREGSAYCAVWIKDDFLYRIDGSLTEPELLQVLDSIR